MIGGANRSAVHLNDRLANRQAQTDAGDRRLFIPAGEFIKDSLFLAGRNTRSVIPNLKQ